MRPAIISADLTHVCPKSMVLGSSMAPSYGSQSRKPGLLWQNIQEAYNSIVGNYKVAAWLATLSRQVS